MGGGNGFWIEGFPSSELQNSMETQSFCMQLLYFFFSNHYLNGHHTVHAYLSFVERTCSDTKETGVFVGPPCFPAWVPLHDNPVLLQNLYIPCCRFLAACSLCHKTIIKLANPSKQAISKMTVLANDLPDRGLIQKDWKYI